MTVSAALHPAAQRGELQVVQQLLAEGANVNDVEPDLNMTPLFAAAEWGHTQIVQVLLAAGANVHATDSTGRTPIYSAACSGHVEVVQLLLAAGADVNGTDRCSLTPLYLAAETGRHDVVQLLLRQGAKPELHDALNCLCSIDRIIYWPAWHGYTGIVQLLLEAWGQPHIPAADLIQAAKLAARTQHMATFARLAKEIRKLYTAELHQLFDWDRPVSAADAVAAVLDAWASDVSSLEQQRAAVRRREEDVAREKQALQRLIVGMAGVARDAELDFA